MPISLTGSVGRMGANNRVEDVRKIQNALNDVPADAGRPVPRLDPDGKCGPKTIEAIQRFQLKHFGWQGADGRVDVGGPTHRKLNEYDGGIVVPPTVEPEITSESFSMRIDGNDMKPRDVEWRILITDEANERSQVYKLEQHIDWPPEIRQNRWGKPYPLSMPQPMPVTGFHNSKFAYKSTLLYNPNKMFGEQETWINTMAFQLVGDQWPTTCLETPACIWDCWNDMQRNPGKPGAYQAEVKGQLKLMGEVNATRAAAFFGLAKPSKAERDRAAAETAKSRPAWAATRNTT